MKRVKKPKRRKKFEENKEEQEKTKGGKGERITLSQLQEGAWRGRSRCRLHCKWVALRYQVGSNIASTPIQWAARMSPGSRAPATQMKKRGLEGDARRGTGQP